MVGTARDGPDLRGQLKVVQEDTSALIRDTATALKKVSLSFSLV
jgi:hypothetical protein